MIEYLRGKLKARLPTGAIVDVSGVGYGVDLPLNVLCDLPPIETEVEFWVHTRVREDSFRLYGFRQRDDRKTFEVLLQVSGIGPKVAMAILSTISVGRLRSIVEHGQVEFLESVPGIGRRTAEKILVELKAKLDRLPMGRSLQEGVVPVNVDAGSALEDGGDDSLEDDLILALANLGYKDKEIHTTLKRVSDHAEARDFSNKLKIALHYLRGGQPSKASRESSAKEQDSGIRLLF